MTKDGKVTLKKPHTIILDILGPFAKKEFHILSREKKAFYRGHIREFVNDPSSWRRRDKGPLKLYYAFAQTIQGQRQLLPNEPRLLDPRNAERDAKAQSLVNYILFSIDRNQTDAPTALFLEYIQAWGYRRGSLKTPVYDDVPVALKKWKEAGIHVLLNLSAPDNFDRIVSATSKGNLRGFFSGNAHPDYTKKGLAAFEKYELVFPIQNVKNVLLVTHSSKEAAGALQAGIPVVLIIRPDLDPDFDKRMSEEKKTYKKKSKDLIKNASGIGIEPFQTAPITDLAPLAATSAIDAGASKIDIEFIESTISDSTREAREEASSTIKYGDTIMHNIIKSLNDLVFK